MESTQFEEIAAKEQGYWWFKVRYRYVADILKEKAPMAGRGVVVDWGCGTGGFIEYLALRGICAKDDLVGYEPSTHARKIMDRRGIPYAVLDLAQPLSAQIEKPIAAITILDVLEHLVDPVQALTYLFEGATLGTRLVALAPAFPQLWSVWDERLGHQRRYTIASLEHEVHAAGWHVVRARYLYSAMYFIGLLRKRLIREKKISEVEFPRVPSWTNWLLAGFFSLESRLPALPFGTSVIVVAEKR